MNKIKKYSGETIRQAIATKLQFASGKCKINGDFQVGNNFEWDVYVDESNNVKTINLLKVAIPANNTIPPIYNFTFNFDKLDSIYAKSAFAKLFQNISDKENDCVKNQFSCHFFFALRNGDSYTVLYWHPSEKYFYDLMECSKPKTWTIGIVRNQTKFLIKSAPYGTSTEVELTTYSIKLDDNDYRNAEGIIKNRKYDTSDWQRLLDRSFEKYWKHILEGEKNQLDKTTTKSEYKKVFENKLPNNQFNDKFFGTDITRSCTYCGIKEDQLSELCKQSKRTGRGYRLEYDRIEDHKDYEIDNVVLACYWCNNAKTDEFSPNEFKEVARGINKTWNRRLARNKKEDNSDNLQWKVEFPEYAQIWEYNHNYSLDEFCNETQDE